MTETRVVSVAETRKTREGRELEREDWKSKLMAWVIGDVIGQQDYIAWGLAAYYIVIHICNWEECISNYAPVFVRKVIFTALAYK